MKIHDEQNRIDFINAMRNADSVPGSTNQFCPTKDSEGGVLKSNSKTIREFLGPNLESISITNVSGFETHERFSLAKDAMSDALQKSPKSIYRYQPWSSSIHPDFIGRVNYSTGNSGDLFLTYGYLCVQDETGKHWWMRFNTLDDLNLTSVQGILSFSQPNGYRLTTNEGHQIWLQVTEDKISFGRLEKLLNARVIVTGETRVVPFNVTTSIPSGKEYFVYGFKIEKAKN